jgi:hypothetical protein
MILLNLKATSCCDQSVCARWITQLLGINKASSVYLMPLAIQTDTTIHASGVEHGITEKAVRYG